MTVEAVIGQQRANIRFEELELRIGDRLLRQRQRIIEQHGNQQENDHRTTFLYRLSASNTLDAVCDRRSLMEVVVIPEA